MSAIDTRGPWTSDPITGWVRNADGKEIFRPVGVSSELLAVLLATPELYALLSRIVRARDASPKGRIALDLDIAINAARALLVKKGL